MIAVVAALAGVTSTTVASAARASIGFAALPARVLQGTSITAAVSVRPGVTCSLAVRYAGGGRQIGLGSARASGGRAEWSWTVPLSAMAGPARATASCGPAGTISRMFLIVGTLIAPRITVEQQGFSVRTRTSGSNASYGLMLRNTSPNADALNVSVLVNFVMADKHLIGSASSTIPVIGANSTYAYGNQLSFPAAAPVDHLEVVIRVGERQPHTLHVPVLQNVHVLPSLYESTWLGEVDGELVNDRPGMLLQNAQLSAVVFDASGKILGGATGSVYGSALPTGTREVFKITTGLNAIPALPGSYAEVSAFGAYAAA